MLFRLKSNLITSFALCLLASCSAEDPAVSESGPAMEFAAGTESRADNPSFSRFNVFADMKLVPTQTPLIVMENIPVSYNQATATWAYDGKYYWFPDYEHSFVAVTPESVLSADNSTKYANSQLSFTYTLPSDAKKATDILAATHRRMYKAGAADPVLLRFGHIMSQINLAATFDDNLLSKDDYLKFLKLELSGFKTKATFNITPAPILTGARTDDSQYVVNGHEGDGKLTVEFANPEKVLNDKKSVRLFNNTDAIIMLPYSFEADSDAKIVLSYSLNDDNSSIKQLTIPLMNQKWELGMSYTYRFTIEHRGPRFHETTITDWNVLDAGNINAH